MTTPKNNEEKYSCKYASHPPLCHCCAEPVSPTPDSMTGDTEFRKDVEKVWDTNGSPNPTDSLVDTFEEITSWRPHDDLVRKQYGEVIRDVKSFISEVRQKAVEETLRDVYKIICSTYGDFHEEEIEIYGKSKGIEL